MKIVVYLEAINFHLTGIHDSHIKWAIVYHT